MEHKMQRLIMEIEDSDDCTYSVMHYVPVLFSSSEEFVICLEDMIKECMVKNNFDNFLLGGAIIEVHFFIGNNHAFYAPKVMTVDDFFKETEARFKLEK